VKWVATPQLLSLPLTTTFSTLFTQNFAMVGIPISDDYDPQPDDDAYPLDLFFYL
jgi:hypothetical protein